MNHLMFVQVAFIVGAIVAKLAQLLRFFATLVFQMPAQGRLPFVLFQAHVAIVDEIFAAVD